MLGAKYIFLGSFVAALTLSLFLFTISAGSAHPSTPTTLIGNEKPEAQTVIAARIEGAVQDQTHSDSASITGTTECKVSPAYPESIRQWCDLITHYAEKRGLEPDLIAALIWQESGGKSKAYSSSGAVGLMQIMPRDGLAAGFMCVNGPCFSNRPTTGELEDPEFNISYGTKMLAGLEARTGDLREALKSYGPMNVGYYYADKVLGIYQRYGAQ